MNPPYVFDGFRGGRGKAYTAMVNKDMAYRGWLKYKRQDKTNTAVN
jgi:hypothetical protein